MHKGVTSEYFVNLPLEQQKKMAKMHGFGENVEAWLEYMKEQDKYCGSVLDLPIEQQREIAKRDGYGDDLEAWRTDVQRNHDEAQAHLASLRMVDYNDLTPEQKVAQDRWQRKVDSGNPVQ